MVPFNVLMKNIFSEKMKMNTQLEQKTGKSCTRCDGLMQSGIFILSCLTLVTHLLTSRFHSVLGVLGVFDTDSFFFKYTFE